MFFILLCYMIELGVGLAISLYLRSFYYPEFEVDLVIKSWLLVNIYKAPVHFILSFFALLILHGKRRSCYLAGMYLAIAILTYLIVAGSIFHSQLFSVKKFWIPTYGEFERQLLVAFLISLVAGLFKWKRIAKLP